MNTKQITKWITKHDPAPVATAMSFIGQVGAEAATGLLFRRTGKRLYKRPALYGLVFFSLIAGIGGVALQKQRENKELLLELPDGDHIHLAESGQLMVERDLPVDPQEKVATLEDGL